MISTLPLRGRLTRLVGEASVASNNELGRYSVDGQVPGAVAFPFREDQVAAVLELAAKEGLAVVPRGNGSLMALGGMPERVDLVLALSKLRHPIEHAPGDLTVTVGAGTKLADLQKRLSENGQWLPLDPPLASHRTVGGVLATNLAGPLSLSHGTARELGIGMRVAGADGVITKSGGKVVKNVTGFDVTKAHLGALGTLGVIVEASFKVWPIPKRDATLMATFELLSAAITASHDLMSRATGPQAVEIAAEIGQPSSVMYARFLGAAASMERRLGESESRLRDTGAASVDMVEVEGAARIWQRQADFGWDQSAGQGILLRLACLPSRTKELAMAVTDMARRHQYRMRLLIGPGNGVVRCLLPGDDYLEDASFVIEAVDGFSALVALVDGYTVVERCPSPVKAHLNVWGEPGESLALMRRLKEQMDPGRILNPGRFVGGI